MKTPIYLDYMATTPVHPEVKEKMMQCLDASGVFGNPASTSHSFGYEASSLVETAREQVATFINADPREIIWTSGATESDNLALIGAARFYSRKGKHIITMATEHKAVLDTCKYLELEGFKVTYLLPKENGLLDIETLRAAITPETILVSIMFVNNETGVIQDIAAIASICHQHGILFHSDAAQAAGKIPIDVKALDVDLMSFSSHKVYGPKGVGALFVRREPRVRLQALIHGGGHEHGMRSGTLPTHQIVGMGEAFEIAGRDMGIYVPQIQKYRDQLWRGFEAIGGVVLNGSPDHRVCSCLNVSFNGVDSDSLMLACMRLAISSGSACNSASPEPSHVLKAMGMDRERAQHALRFSLGRFTTEEEIEFTINEVAEQVHRLRSMAPLWDNAAQKALNKKYSS